MGHYGVDLSANNRHPINWGALHADLSARGGGTPFVVVKVNEGTGYVNPFLAGDVAGARAAGFAVAGYVYDHGTVSVGAEQATYDAAVGGLPEVDDDEAPSGDSAAAYAAHCRQLAAENPHALVYLDESRATSGAFPEGGGLYLAYYNNSPGTVPSLPGRTVLIHQYSETGTAAGVAGDVDLDYWTGTEAEFDAFFNPGSTPSPQTQEVHRVNASTALPDGRVFTAVVTPETPPGLPAVAAPLGYVMFSVTDIASLATAGFAFLDDGVLSDVDVTVLPDGRVLVSGKGRDSMVWFDIWGPAGSPGWQSTKGTAR